MPAVIYRPCDEFDVSKRLRLEPRVGNQPSMSSGWFAKTLLECLRWKFVESSPSAARWDRSLRAPPNVEGRDAVSVCSRWRRRSDQTSDLQLGERTAQSISLGCEVLRRYSEHQSMPRLSFLVMVAQTLQTSYSSTRLSSYFSAACPLK